VRTLLIKGLFMTMHLHHPALSLNGHRKGKVKFRNADEARRARELEADWEKLKQKWQVPVTDNKKKMSYKSYNPTARSNIRDTGPRPPSLNSGDMGPAVKPAAKVYTGTKMLGIGTMHKSNSVPIFSEEEAVAISTMRR